MPARPTLAGMTHAEGYYNDPEGPGLLRKWQNGQWSILTSTGPADPPAARNAAYVGKSEPAPVGAPVRLVAVNATPSASNDSGSSDNSATVIAVLWAVVAIIIGIAVITGVDDEQYGGDAYTGIQNTTAQGVRAIGWLIISTGPLGIIIARSRR